MNRQDIKVGDLLEWTGKMMNEVGIILVLEIYTQDFTVEDPNLGMKPTLTKHRYMPERTVFLGLSLKDNDKEVYALNKDTESFWRLVERAKTT